MLISVWFYYLLGHVQRASVCRLQEVDFAKKKNTPTHGDDDALVASRGDGAGSLPNVRRRQRCPVVRCVVARRRQPRIRCGTTDDHGFDVSGGRCCRAARRCRRSRGQPRHRQRWLLRRKPSSPSRPRHRWRCLPRRRALPPASPSCVITPGAPSATQPKGLRRRVPIAARRSPRRATRRADPAGAKA